MLILIINDIYINADMNTHIEINTEIEVNKWLNIIGILEEEKKGKRISRRIKNRNDRNDDGNSRGTILDGPVLAPCHHAHHEQQ